MNKCASMTAQSYLAAVWPFDLCVHELVIRKQQNVFN